MSRNSPDGILRPFLPPPRPASDDGIGIYLLDLLHLPAYRLQERRHAGDAEDLAADVDHPLGTHEHRPVHPLMPLGAPIPRIQPLQHPPTLPAHPIAPL